MEQKEAHPERLALTQAEQAPPPERTAPEPAPQTRKQQGSGPPAPGGPDQDALLQVKRFAERIGGLQRLHQLVEELIRLKD